MSEQSKKFEQQIARIHELLEVNNAEVIWNEKIPDPDNPAQLRQIDFSIRNKNSFVVGECRLRQAPEDVQWIEELIGRRTSLKADGIIAVSSSGFTKGAITKAKAHGIIIRNLYEIEDKELISWGKKIELELILSTFEALTFKFIIPAGGRFGPITDLNGNKIQWVGFLQNIAHKVDDLKPKNNPSNFQVDCLPEHLYVEGKKIEKLSVIGRLKKFNQKVMVSSIFYYAENRYDKTTPLAIVQKFGTAASEVVTDIDNVHMIVDFSEIPLPQNTVFYGVHTDFGRIVNLQNFEIVGLENAAKINFNIEMQGVHDKN